MQITVDIFTIIIMFGIAQGNFLALILFRNKNGNFKANRFMALLLCAFSASISNIVLIKTGLYRVFPYMFKLPAIITLLFGPLFYFYVRFLIWREYRFKLKDALHFLPAFLVFIHFIRFFLANDATKFAFILNGHHKLTPEHYEYLFILFLSQLQLWTYLVCIRRSLKQYQSKVKEYYSDTEKVNLNWINFFISIFCSVHITFIFLIVLVLKSNYILTYNILGITVSFAIFVLGYRGLNQAEIFSLLDPVQSPKSNPSSISPETAETYITRLDNLMVQEKIYANPDLTLDDLAKRMLISRNVLSQLFNDSLGTNFYDYINRFRVEEMKRLLMDPEKEYLTIIALSTEAGFNSKTTFNRVFKQYTRMTPSQFKQQYCQKTPA